ncbi:MAG: PepSY domain-containing protein [Salinivirgaceae bacterium]
MNKRKSILKTLHRWPGLIAALVLLYFAASGILMNHRSEIAGLDVDRKHLPEAYRLSNWNLASLKGNAQLSTDTVLLFGNIGIWQTDSAFSHFKNFNSGFPNGADHHKIYDVHKTDKDNLYAATLMGLYTYKRQQNKWVQLSTKGQSSQFVGIESVGDTLYAMNRSAIYKGGDNGVNSIFERYEINAPENYEPSVTLFKTIWQIHSGEIFGLGGKLFTDVLALITLLLSITGIIYFIFPGLIKWRKKRGKKAKSYAKTLKWSLKWHNLTGKWLFVFLIILFFSGMFLRPPLLIPIAGVELPPIKYTHLDQSNVWYDNLRDMHYDTSNNRFIIATTKGLYSLEKKLKSKPIKFKYQPPVSVMGITVLKPYSHGAYLIGSFSGLFLWHPGTPEILDFTTGKPYAGSPDGRPVGNTAVTGYIDFGNNEYLVDYDRGALSLWHNKPFWPMPEQIKDETRMSLWNFALEVHTGRIFSGFLGSFYILLVPLGGLLAVIVVLSGYLLYRKRSKRKKRT